MESAMAKAHREGRLEGARMMYIDVMFDGQDEYLTQDQEVEILGLAENGETVNTGSKIDQECNVQ